MNTTQIDQRDLVKAVRTFRDCTEELAEINKRVQKLREIKKLAEEEMSDILKRSVFASLDDLKLSDSSTVKIQRPGTYSKPWSLSKRDLEGLIAEYFRGVGAKSEASSCFEFIVERRKRDLVAKDFSFTRVVNVTDNGGEDGGATD
jgi:hypothetical protein